MLCGVIRNNPLHLCRFLSSKVLNPTVTPMYLNQENAQKLDQDLFSECGFSVDQLMELAGLACALIIHEVYPPSSFKNVLICVGPGNNGGDGLVAARHLKLAHYNPTVYFPKVPTLKSVHGDLIKQIEAFDIPTTTQVPTNDLNIDLMIDSLFGFSFKPPVRKAYSGVMDFLVSNPPRVPIVSIDIPSGWDVEKGLSDQQQQHIRPDCLISLTAPKLCARAFTGPHHYLAGRFVPEIILKRYGLYGKLPEYSGSKLFVKL